MIKDQKELASLLKLCRKQGVSEITFEGVSIKFGDLPAPKAGRQDDDGDDEAPDPNIDPLTGLHNEALMFLSAPNPGGP